VPARAQYQDWLLNSGCLLHAVNAERFKNSLKMQAVRDVRRELAHIQRASSTLACMDALPDVRRRPETLESKVTEPKPWGGADSPRQSDVTHGSRGEGGHSADRMETLLGDGGHSAENETEEALLSILIPRL
jgi:hypothetical protein